MLCVLAVPKKTTLKDICIDIQISLWGVLDLCCLRSRAGLQGLQRGTLYRYSSNSRLREQLSVETDASLLSCFVLISFHSCQSRNKCPESNIGKFLWCVWLVRFSLAFEGDCLSNRQFQQFGFIWRNYGFILGFWFLVLFLCCYGNLPHTPKLPRLFWLEVLSLYLHETHAE